MGCAVIALTTVMTHAAESPEAPGSRDARVILVAHRGALDQGYAENTLAAFRHAIASGALAIEIDLRGTRDGEIVVIHDDTVERTTDGSGSVAEMSLAELRRLDAGKGERMPTCEEVLELVAGTGVLLVVDVKQGATFDRERLIRLVERHGAVSQLVVGVRNLEDLAFFRKRNGDLRTLGFVKEVEDIEAFAKAGVAIVRLWPKWIEADPGLFDRVRKLGKPVWVTAGMASREEVEALVRLGASGIISDRLEVIRALRER